jgi:putative colanic acid biosynthesis UDP-glucose lipid carrier transferase
MPLATLQSNDLMKEPIVLRQSLWVALVAAVQFLAAPVVLSGSLALVIMRVPVNLAPSFRDGPPGVVTQILVRWAAVVGLLLLLGYVVKATGFYSRRVTVGWILAVPLLLVSVSVLLRAVLARFIASEAIRRVVFAGCNDVSLSLAERLRERPDYRMSVVGFFDDRSADRLNFGDETQLLGRLPDLANYAKDNGIHVIFVALPIRHVQRVLDLLDDLKDTTTSIYYVPDIFLSDLIQSRSGDILGIPVIAMCETPFFGYRGVAKRVTDVVLAAMALFALLPVLLAVAIAVKATSPGPIIFRQRRYGLDGQEITVYKFRTMTVTEDGERVVQATAADSRVTPVGRFLRRYSLDELPQLINVLQGRMSMVGPRPHAIAHNEQYRKLIKGYMVRHKVLPGITGLAQVNGCRGETARIEEMQARVEYDLEYLRRWSIALDVKILFKTAWMVLGDKKAY